MEDFKAGDKITPVSPEFETTDITRGSVYTVTSCDDGLVRFNDNVGYPRIRRACGYKLAAPVEEPRLVIDQLWAHLQAQGLTAQQVRAAIRNCNMQTLAGWRSLLEMPHPLVWMFVWEETPEGGDYWNRLDNLHR